VDERRVLRVFISSPADVRPERLMAEQVVRRLDLEFSHYFRVAPVLWEREPLTADAHFQERITLPSATDIVVVVLWSQLGLPLPAEKFRGPLSGRTVTGTEWEFEDALKAKRERGLPELLLLQKTARIEGYLDDEAELETRLTQRRLVRQFLDRWVGSAASGGFKAAAWEFADAAGFETLLEEQLRALLRKRLGDGAASATGRPITWHQGSPYRGLQSFEPEHAPVFYGRRRARNELRELLVRQIARGRAFVLVLGASGCGKSSLVKAGLLPELALPGMIRPVALCRHAITRPGNGTGAPLEGLAVALLSATALPELTALRYDAAALAELLRDAPRQAVLAVAQALDRAGQAARLTPPGEARLLLVVDQLEELFTAEAAASESRERYVDALDALAQSGHVWVIATLRSDFFDRLPDLPALAALSAGEARYLLTPPDAAELGQIIREPARQAGLQFEVDPVTGTSLDEAIRGAAATDPAALPLLQYLLQQLWLTRIGGGVLTHAAYKRLGGLEGAIGRRAEEVLAALSEPVQTAFPSVLRALVTVGDLAHAAPAARMVTLDQFAPETPSRQLIEALLAPDARILVAEGEGGVTRLRIAHEALLTHWPRAREQIAADRQDLQIRGRLEAAAGRWRAATAGDRSSLLLPRGLPLAEAEGLLARRRVELGDDLVAYVEASAAAVRTAERRALRRLQLVAAVLAFLALAATAGAALAYFGQSEAQRQQQLASRQEAEARHRLAEAQVTQSRFLADRSRAALATGDVAKAELLSLAGLPVHPDRPDRPLVPEALAALRQAALLDRQRGELRAHKVMIDEILFNSDGSRLATRSINGMTVLWNARYGTPLAVLRGASAALAFAPDGRQLASRTRDGAVQLWDADSGAGPKMLEHAAGASSQIGAALAFSPDGRVLAAETGDGAVRLWSVENGKTLAALDKGEAPIIRLAFDRTGARLATAAADGTVAVWDAHTGASLAKFAAHASAVGALAFSPDGARLATGARDGTARLWDTGSGALVQQLPAHPKEVTEIAFNASGDRLLTWSFGTARLHDPRNGADILQVDDAVSRGTFSPDGGRFAVALGDGSVRLFDAQSGAELAQLRGHQDTVTSIAFSPDGTVLASAGMDRTVRLWDAHTGRAIATLKGHAERVTTIGFSPDGQHLASGGWDGEVRLWDAHSRVLIADAKGSDSDWSIHFSSDGSRLAIARPGDSVQLWDVTSGRALGRIAGPKGTMALVSVSPDGNRLATATLGGLAARVWDVASGSLVAAVPGRISVLDFGPDGRVFAAGGADGVIHLWTAGRGTSTLAGTAAGVTQFAFSADGRRLLAGAADGSVRLWDVAGGQSLLTVKGDAKPVTALALSPDGARLASGAADGTVQLWDAHSGAAVTKLAGHAKTISGLAFNADGSRLISRSVESARLWRAGDGAPIAELQGDANTVLAVEFNRDGRRLAVLHSTKSFEQTVELRGTADGRLIAELRDPGERVATFAFSPAGDRVATGAGNGRVRLWDAVDGGALAELRGGKGSMWKLAFDPDGRQLTAASLDGAVWRWPIQAVQFDAAALIAWRQIVGLRVLTAAEREEAFLAPAPDVAGSEPQASTSGRLAHDPEAALLQLTVAASQAGAKEVDALSARRGTLACNLDPERAIAVWRQAQDPHPAPLAAAR
jgi:WD40 repeat protein